MSRESRFDMRKPTFLVPLWITQMQVVSEYLVRNPPLRATYNGGNSPSQSKTHRQFVRTKPKRRRGGDSGVAALLDHSIPSTLVLVLLFKHLPDHDHGLAQSNRI